MKNSTIVIAVAMLLAMFIVSQTQVGVAETLIWSENVYSTGVPVTSPVLEAGREYRIVAKEIFFYNSAGNFWADAQYYTDGIYGPFTPDGHSFLQIDGQDVYWGPYKYDHTYSINYTGTGSAITFTIVDWIDGDYSNNYCHLPVEIWAQPTPPPPPPPPPEAGYSPGYWGHQFKVYYNLRGSAQVSWEDLVTLTAKINGYCGIDPPAFNGYPLPPVNAMDTDGNGVFEPYDAYTVLAHVNAWRTVWLGCANWYNWAAGYGPYDTVGG